ncbi:hypothetical protein CPB84DRAFT_1801607 [Gymnopilus junonius]|uniref:Uncharacterized protein n=1 Tax=Gymnopilus junonius TaxID=109634 RepID=A0A9P5N6Y7_GYMJU|nr:hypothetical protein CPB84DRAFT_1801607 [Gymnopilus junonius]
MFAVSFCSRVRLRAVVYLGLTCSFSLTLRSLQAFRSTTTTCLYLRIPSGRFNYPAQATSLASVIPDCGNPESSFIKRKHILIYQKCILNRSRSAKGPENITIHYLRNTPIICAPHILFGLLHVLRCTVPSA